MGYKAQRRKCVATAKSTGLPCAAYACINSVVCQKHGGLAPQVQNKAKERQDDIQVTVLERMELLVPKAMERAEKILLDDDARASDHLKAIEMVLDRFVARKVHAEVTDDREVRQLDQEIASLIAEEEETG